MDKAGAPPKTKRRAGFIANQQETLDIAREKYLLISDNVVDNQWVGSMSDGTDGSDLRGSQRTIANT